MHPIQGVPAAWTSAAQMTSAPGNTAAGSAVAGSTMTEMAPSGGPDAAAGTSAFRQLMVDGLQQVETLQQAADLAVERLGSHPHGTSEVLSAVQKADLSFRTMMQIRDQLVQAYQEIRDIRI